MSGHAFECVGTKCFLQRVAVAIKDNNKDLARLHVKAKAGPSAFACYSQDIIKHNVLIATLNQVAAIRSPATVESVQGYALQRILSLADSDHSDRNELAAWARIVDLTKVASLHYRGA